MLRLGVALLGVRITFGQIAQWAGASPPRGVRDRDDPGLDRRGAFCWLQQAVRLLLAAPPRSAALRRHWHCRPRCRASSEGRATTFTVIGVSTLSTLAMVLYPMLAHLTDLSPVAAGVFLGGSIHEVAQVVGAGYSMSRETGDMATVVKLMRVAMLLPVIVCAAMIARAQGDGNAGPRPPLLPWFAVAFLVVAAVNSVGWIGEGVQSFGERAVAWCLAVAMSAIGMNTQLKEIVCGRLQADRSDDRRGGVPRRAGAIPVLVVALRPG